MDAKNRPKYYYELDEFLKSEATHKVIDEFDAVLFKHPKRFLQFVKDNEAKTEGYSDLILFSGQPFSSNEQQERVFLNDILGFTSLNYQAGGAMKPHEPTPIVLEEDIDIVRWAFKQAKKGPVVLVYGQISAERKAYFDSRFETKVSEYKVEQLRDLSALFDKTTSCYPILVLDEECYRGDDLRCGSPDIVIRMLQIGSYENEQDLHQANGRIKRLDDKGEHFMVAGLDPI